MRGCFTLLGFLLIAFLLLGCLRGWYTVQKKPQSIGEEIHTLQIEKDIDKVGR